MKKYYLDTSTVRQYSNKLEKFKNKNIFTSILVIFELLSGVNNEKEFFLRKSVIKNLCKSNIQIDWSFYIEKMYQSFGIKYISIESVVIKEFFKKILLCNTFQEFKDFRVYINNGDYYLFESIKSFDDNIMDAGKLYSKNAMHEWRNLNIQDKKEVKNKILENTNYLCQQNLKDLSINCAETLSISNQIINSYNNELDVYLFNNSLFFINKEINGQECGKNDTLDLLHLIYLSKGDFIISEDKIFKKLSKENNIFETYTGKEFLDFINT